MELQGKRLFSAAFLMCLNILALAQTGIGTTSPVNRFQVETVLADPATSGTGANGNIRISGTSGNHVLDFGLSVTNAYSWLQSRNRTNYGAPSPLVLNPRGGNVGIGNTNPGNTLEVGAADGTIPGFLVLHPTTSGSGLEGGELNIRPAPGVPNAQSWVFDQVSNANVPRLRIFPTPNGETSGLTIRDNGNVGLGWSNPTAKLHISTSDPTGLYIESSNQDNNGIIRLNANTASNWAELLWHEFLIFDRQGARIGAVVGSRNGTEVVYQTTSDYRLKTDLKDFSGLDLVRKIKTYDYAWKLDNSRSYGVMAHELQEVLPYAVAGTKDAVDQDGKIIPQGVDYGKLTPILIKALQEQDLLLQEQKKQIEALQKRLELLESRN